MIDQEENLYYKRFLSIGISDKEARLLARIKAEIEKNPHFYDSMKKDGFSGLEQWIESKYMDIYPGRHISKLPNILQFFT